MQFVESILNSYRLAALRKLF